MQVKVLLVLCVIFVIVVMVGFLVGPTLTPPAAPAAVVEPPTKSLSAGVDEFNALTRRTMGSNLFESYRVKGDVIVLHVNPQLWNRLSNGEQRQLCDVVAHAAFLQNQRLSLARLMVMKTTIGRIAVETQQFRPELASLE